MLGQNTLLVNDILPLLTYASDIQSEIELTGELTAVSYVFYMEETIQLEDWMIEKSQWEEASAGALASALKVEPEAEITTEDWMTRPFTAVAQDWEFLTEVEEEPLVVRKWMICCSDWNLQPRHNKILKVPDITLK
jgi:hypothetical protein